MPIVWVKMIWLPDAIEVSLEIIGNQWMGSERAEVPGLQRFQDYLLCMGTGNNVSYIFHRQTFAQSIELGDWSSRFARVKAGTL